MLGRVAAGVAVALTLAGCSDAGRAVAPSMLYSSEFYGFDPALCDPPTNPACQPQQLTASQRVQVNAAIQSLACAEIRDYLWGMAFDGAIESYNTDDGNWGDSHWPTDPHIHIWSGTFDSSRLAETLAHEGAHILYATTSEVTADQAEIDCGTRS
jgi:hypothetical protein